MRGRLLSVTEAAQEREIVLGGSDGSPATDMAEAREQTLLAAYRTQRNTPQSHFQQHKASINSINTSKVSLYRLCQKHHHRHHCPCSVHRTMARWFYACMVKSCVNHCEVGEKLMPYTLSKPDSGQSFESCPRRFYFCSSAW